MTMTASRRGAGTVMLISLFVLGAWSVPGGVRAADLPDSLADRVRRSADRQEIDSLDFLLTLSPTKSQARAIETVGRDLCVTAGAGCGKTFTLVERFLHLVASRETSVAGILATLAFRRTNSRLTCLILLTLLGVGLEIGQTFVPGRTFEVWDMMANGCGACAALTAALTASRVLPAWSAA